MNNIIWRSDKRNISDLNPAEYNPRQLTDKQAKDLLKSLDKFNLADPIVINADNTIIGGHQRINILKSKGITEVDVRVPNRALTKDEEMELNLRLNRNLGEWDIDALANIDEDLLKSIGFESKELDRIFQLKTKPEDDEIPEKPPIVAKLGDIWQLGRHRVMCGDSTQREAVSALMGGNKADMVFTDPPYGVSYADKNKYLNSIAPGNRIQTPIENDHKSVEEIQNDIIYPAFCNLRYFLKDDGVYYITSPQGGDLLMMMMMMIEQSGLKLRHMLIWVKNNHVLGRTDYNYKHEPIFYGWSEKHNFYGNGEHQFSTWEIDKPHKSDLHPTMKPVSLIVNALQNSTQRYESCLDLFLGSGSTLIACEKTNRICYGMEIDPHYCDVIIKRWEDYTGLKAEKVN